MTAPRPDVPTKHAAVSLPKHGPKRKVWPAFEQHVLAQAMPHLEELAKQDLNIDFIVSEIERLRRSETRSTKQLDEFMSAGGKELMSGIAFGMAMDAVDRDVKDDYDAWILEPAPRMEGDEMSRKKPLPPVSYYRKEDGALVRNHREPPPCLLSPVPCRDSQNRHN